MQWRTTNLALANCHCAVSGANPFCTVVFYSSSLSFLTVMAYNANPYFAIVLLGFRDYCAFIAYLWHSLSNPIPLVNGAIEVY